MRELADFLKNGLCDNVTAQPSFGRISCAIVIYFLICWESYLVSKAGVWVDIPNNWLALILAIWAVAKGAETAKAHIDSKCTSEGTTDVGKP